MSSLENTSRVTIWREQFEEKAGVWVLSIGTREFDMTFGEWFSSVVITILLVGFSRFIYNKMSNRGASTRDGPPEQST